MGDVIPFKPRDPSPCGSIPAPSPRPPIQIAWGGTEGKRSCFASFPDVPCVGVGGNEAEAIEGLAYVLADFVRGHASTIALYHAKLVAAGLLPRE